MDIDLFDYKFDEKLIARYPVKNRDSSRLLAVDVGNFRMEHKRFYDIVDYVNEGDAIVVNSSYVRKARIKGNRRTGGRVEIFVTEFPVRISFPLKLKVLLKSHKTIKDGESISVGSGFFVDVVRNLGKGLHEISIKSREEYEYVFGSRAEIPLPPYLKREPEDIDDVYYQTVYANASGGFSVAAPTAGLHFTEELIKKIEGKGAGFTDIALNIGLGTFMPVREKEIENHDIHGENYTVGDKTAAIVNSVVKNGNNLILTGTSSVRCLESAAGEDGTVSSCEGSYTDLYIYPGYRFKIKSSLITNFHQPKSSLYIMICALIGVDKTRAVYEEAVREGYSLFSFGDAMYLYNIPF